MLAVVIKLIAISTLITVNSVHAIGEGVVDLNTIAGIFGGVANIFINFNTSDVETDRIMGRWFQMYKAAINFDVFQTNMYCHVSYFYRNKVMGPQGFSIEEAYHVIGKSGPIETYKRDVTRTGSGEYWMYTEEYFYPRQFYILKVGPDLDNENSIIDENVLVNSTDDTNATEILVRKISQRKQSSSSKKAQYEYLVATDQNRLALMVYARDPVKFYEVYDKEILKELQKGGFGGYVFWNQPVAIYQGTDCYYPSQKEVFARRALKASGNRQVAFQATSLSQGADQGAGAGAGGINVPPAIASLLQQQQQQLLQQQQQQQLQSPLQGAPSALQALLG